MSTPSSSTLLAPATSSSAASNRFTVFTKFGLLPPELRQEIFRLSIRNIPAVPIVRWNRRIGSFIPGRKTPSILHVNREAREMGLKHWELAFGSANQPKKIYVNFEVEPIFFRWDTTGPSPGILSDKMEEEDFRKVRSLLINEEDLLAHATDCLEEFEPFTALESICVICDETKIETGDKYGQEKMEEHFRNLDKDPGKGDFIWPTVVCTSPHGDEACSRHWWFEAWNQRATSPSRSPDWQDDFAECLVIANEDEAAIADELLFGQPYERFMRQMA